MKYIILLSIAALLFVDYANSATWFRDIPEREDSPGKCFIELDEGESFYKEGECHRYTCLRSRRAGYMTLSGSSCGTVGHPEECILLPEDNTKKYPNCCPEVSCPNNL
ncbi:U-scoloptoxin(16)-Er13a-like [Periplaneta americana]|uniref:U-scoloptoxin(16)-Er12a-like n=1 Tax=Periplaneta americana TaxID=6978 RepID=UPI0037E80A8E